MRLDVLDADTLARVGWVDVWVSLYWDSPYYSEGSFTLEVRPTTENLQLLQEGRWLVRSDENPRIPMRICSRANQNEDANLVVSGYPATWLLTKRVSAVSIKNQPAEAAMRSLVSAAKPWPRLELGTEYGFDTTFEKQTSGGSIFDYCKTIGQACDLGFRIVLDGKVWSGAAGFAGELHFLPIEHNMEYAQTHFADADMTAYMAQVICACGALINPDRVVLYTDPLFRNRVEDIRAACARTDNTATVRYSPLCQRYPSRKYAAAPP